MAEIIMPKMGDAMTEGKVVRWYKQAGDAVKKGEPVAEIETDKVNLDLEAESDGTLGEHAANEGDVVPVGGLLTTVLAEGEKAPEPKAEPQQRRATDKKDSVKHTTGEYHEAIEQKGPRRDKTVTTAETPRATDSTRPRSSPLARKVAADLGVSLEQIQG
ncbi:MAG TPA: biotin/lipoyl-containing protein, partial [Thermoanaerobaculia bacterium]|nr:biotin/lipoyl-containing protein [Thermoanaerobaculia bacterium]